MQNAVPHHAVSKDGGKTWEVKKFTVDAQGELHEEVLPKTLPKAASTGRTMESILNEYASEATLSKDNVFTIKTGDNDAVDALATDLGLLLIGKHYKDEGLVGVEETDVVVKLDKIQSEILRTFAELKGLKISM